VYAGGLRSRAPHGFTLSVLTTFWPSLFFTRLQLSDMSDWRDFGRFQNKQTNKQAKNAHKQKKGTELVACFIMLPDQLEYHPLYLFRTTVSLFSTFF